MPVETLLVNYPLVVQIVLGYDSFYTSTIL